MKFEYERFTLKDIPSVGFVAYDNETKQCFIDINIFEALLARIAELEAQVKALQAKQAEQLPFDGSPEKQSPKFADNERVLFEGSEWMIHSSVYHSEVGEWRYHIYSAYGGLWSGAYERQLTPLDNSSDLP